MVELNLRYQSVLKCLSRNVILISYTADFMWFLNIYSKQQNGQLSSGAGVPKNEITLIYMFFFLLLQNCGPYNLPAMVS